MSFAFQLQQATLELQLEHIHLLFSLPDTKSVKGSRQKPKSQLRNPSKSILPVAAAQPAHAAALPAIPPITMFEVFSRFSQTV